ncbi:protein CREG1-like [Montipora foliosa]|uniref:protein CREG1-like n=1 Tax=Montipora foliosa TaxID=591990 RepID=UPI0035F18AAD
MGVPREKVKLLLEDLETTPAISVKKVDSDATSYPTAGFNVCFVLSVLLIYVALGTLIAAATYRNLEVEPEAVFIDTGYGRYHKSRVFQHGKSYPEEKWNKIRVDGKSPHDLIWRKFKFVDTYDPPPRSEKAKTARYIVHNSLWGSVSTISKSLDGAPFSMVMSFSDGTVDNSTGIPYFYLSAFDPVAHNIKSNNLASFSISEAQSDYCKEHSWDPEEPLCSRVTLNGKLLHVPADELKFAQNALFSRHPVMKTWPKDHDWQTLKLNITRVWLQDIYGPANIIPLEDYLKANL